MYSRPKQGYFVSSDHRWDSIHVPPEPAVEMIRMDRRNFIAASTVGCAGMMWKASSTAQAKDAVRKPQSGAARSTILFFLSGGASHIDMWDMKPEAPREYRGPFEPIQTSAPGVMLCEHLPMLARQAHLVSLVNSVGGTVNTNDHHAGYYYNLTGHVPDQSFRTLGNSRTPFPTDWPAMGAVVASKRKTSKDLPNFITLPHKEGAPAYTRPGQFAARLGLKFDPLYIHGDPDNPLKFQVPALALQDGTNIDRLNDRRELLRTLDQSKRELDQFEATRTWTAHQDRAISMLKSAQTTEAFDVTQESEGTRERYGQTVNGMSLLVARRLVEAEVPFITVFWKGNPDEAKKRKCASGGGWDTHGNNFNCLKDWLLPEFDRAYSALLEDLHQRGLLDQTLVLVTSEMGRKPKIGDPRSGGVSGAGRDHWTHCLTDVLAGGGISGGQTFGSSDRFAEYPADQPVTPADITRTVYHAMGIEDTTAYDTQNRPYQLLEGGEPLTELF